MPLFKLEQFNGTVPKLLHWFQCVPEFPSSCNYGLLFLLLVVNPTFSIKLLSHAQILIPCLRTAALVLVSPQCISPMCCKPF